MKSESSLRNALVALSILSQVPACSDASGPRTGEPGTISGTTDEPQETTSEPVVRTYADGLSLRLTNAEIVDEIEMTNGNRVVFVANDSAGTAIEFGPVGNGRLLAEIESKTNSLLEQFKLLAPGRPVPKALTGFGDGKLIGEEASESSEPVQVGVAGEPLPEASESNLESAGEHGDGLYANGLCGEVWFLTNHCALTTRSGGIPKQFWQQTMLTNAGVKIANVSSSRPNQASQGQTVVCGDLGKVTAIVSVLDPGNVSLQAEVPAGMWWSSGKWKVPNWCTPDGTCFVQYAIATTQVQVPSAGGSRYHWCGYFN